MPTLSADDFKSVLLDLYLAQRENAELRALLTHQQEDGAIPPVIDGEEPE